MKSKFFLLPMFLLAATLAQANEPAKAAAPKADPTRGQQIASGTCVACHNADGNSTIAINPKLAGQHEEYLYKQMKAFKPVGDTPAERPNAVMMGMAGPLSDQDMRDVSAWFASQAQKNGKAKDDGTVEAGKKLYRAGNISKGLPACAGCHGPTGSGIPVQYPRIAGQHAEYIEAQLKAFRTGADDPKDATGRANDPNKMMRLVAIKMTDAEIKAVANYVAGLR